MTIAHDINITMPDGWTVTAIIDRNGKWEVTASDDIGNHVMTFGDMIEDAIDSAVEAITQGDYWRVSKLNQIPERPPLSLSDIGLHAAPKITISRRTLRG